MNIVILIIGFISLIIAVLILCSKLNNTFYFIVMSMFSISTTCLLKSTTDFCKQYGALEVYRNNTELKIKYEIVNNDTINCDSIVIFKK